MVPERLQLNSSHAESSRVHARSTSVYILLAKTQALSAVTRKNYDCQSASVCQVYLPIERRARVKMAWRSDASSGLSSGLDSSYISLFSDKSYVASPSGASRAEVLGIAVATDSAWLGQTADTPIPGTRYPRQVTLQTERITSCRRALNCGRAVRFGSDCSQKVVSGGMR
jgi:hypothetical protein